MERALYERFKADESAPARSGSTSTATAGRIGRVNAIDRLDANQLMTIEERAGVVGAVPIARGSW